MNVPTRGHDGFSKIQKRVRASCCLPGTVVLASGKIISGHEASSGRADTDPGFVLSRTRLGFSHCQAVHRVN